MPLTANPLISTEAFDILYVSGRPNPGLARLIEGGARPYNWDIKDTAGTQGSTTTYRGFKNSEHIKFRFEFWEAPQLAEFYSVYLPLLKYDATKKDPKPFDVAHPVLQANEILTLITSEVGPLVDMGSQLWSVTVEFIEYRPAQKKNVTTTPKSTTTSNQEDQKPTAQTAQDRELAALTVQFQQALAGIRATHTVP